MRLRHINRYMGKGHGADCCGNKDERAAAKRQHEHDDALLKMEEELSEADLPNPLTDALIDTDD